MAEGVATFVGLSGGTTDVEHLEGGVGQGHLPEWGHLQDYVPEDFQKPSKTSLVQFPRAIMGHRPLHWTNHFCPPPNAVNE